jgi:hypothetical protein
MTITQAVLVVMGLVLAYWVFRLLIGGRPRS